MSFPAYPSYKKTGIEWLGEVPGHWKLKRLRHLLLDGAEGIKIGPFGSQLTSDMLVDFGYKVYGQENVIADNFSKGARFISDEKFREMSVYKISPGDLLVTMMGTAGRCKTVPGNVSPGIMDSHLLRMRFNQECLPDFGELLIDKSIYINHQVRLNGKGSIMHGLNSSIIKELLVALPPVDEQASMLSFLDHETARIDALIEEQQRLIELLKEKRQAVISHAVTKGLDPTVPMKDSGVEWLGEVPAHWVVLAIKWRARIKSGDGISPDLIESQAQEDKPHPVIGGNGVMGFTSQANVSPPLIVIGRVGALCGNVHKIHEPAWVSDNALILDFDRRSFDINYLVHALDARNLNEISDKSAQPLITGSKVTSQYIPCPDRHEQLAISKFLEGALSEFDQLVLEGIKGIELLKERRSALISAAVTGKIDVRAWQPPASAPSPELVQEAV